MGLAPFSRRALSLTTVAALASSGRAEANGRYPASGQIAVHPTDANTLLVRATYGIMLTGDAGKSWGWICEPAVGYGNFEDPMVGFTANGALLAGMFEGLSVGQPGGCQWSLVPGGLENKYVIDLAVDKVDPAKGVVIISNSVGQDDAGAPLFLTQLWQTTDNGATWAQAGVDLPPQFLGLTVDTAPSNPQRVYMSGRYGQPDYLGAIERSDDRGATWQRLPVAAADATHLPYLGGVDPNDPDVLYVRLDADPSDALLVSRDGGMTWTVAFSATGKLNGFAISPDGVTVTIGGPGIAGDGGTVGAGVWTAPSSTLAFTKVSDVGALCLTWAPSGLYACADEFVDHFTAGLSTDEGKTFTPLMHLQELCGPLACGPTTSVGAQCPATWAATQAVIDATCPGGDAGAGSSSGATGGAASGKGACSCALPGRETGGLLALSLAAAGAVALRARRTARRRA